MAKRPRQSKSADEDEDNCASGPVPASVHKWSHAPWPGKLQAILDALEIDALDEGSRLCLQRQLYLGTLFDQDRAGHVILTLRCIAESEGNQGALDEIYIRAVSSAIGPYAGRGLALIEAFDSIPLLSIFEQMRALDYFYVKEAPSAFERILKHKLRRMLGPQQELAAPPQTRQERLAAAKARVAAARLATVERNIEMGRKMVALRDMTPCNKKFGRLRAQQFDVAQPQAAEMLRVARMYGDRPEVYRNTAWPVLVELSSGAVPKSSRLAFERRIQAGEAVKAKEVAAARRAAT